jgi:multiple sugar transport system permease protein/arabinogalactan oligomer/maltooligosaccharide transport system permease protein
LKELKEKLTNLAFVIPLIIVFLLIIIIPFIQVIRLSFFKETFDGSLTFVGLRNYIRLFQQADFMEVLLNTLAFTFGGVLMKVGSGFILALILYKNFRFKNVFMLIVLIPWAIPFSISHIAWRWMYDALYGHINSLLMHLNIIQLPIEWLSNPNFSLWGVLIANSWTGAPFCAFAILSGLYCIPLELYEAAGIDGANNLQKFFSITLPLVKQVLLLISALTAIWTFNNFGAIWLMTQGGPVNSSTTLIVSIYRNAFEFSRPGYASALSVLSAIFLIILTSYYVFYGRKGDLG